MLNVGASQSGVTASATSYDAGTNTSKATLTVSAANWPATSQVAIRVTWAATDAPPTNVQLWRPGATIGDLFYKPLLAMLAPFSTLRMMDTLAINNSALADFAKRPLPTWRNYPSGISLEDCIALAKQTGKDVWIPIHYLIGATQGYDAVVAWLAQNVPVGSPFHVYVQPEGNEVWNSSFVQWKQNQTAAASNAAVHFDGMGDPNILGWRQTAFLTVQFAQAIAKAYGVPWRQTPIRPVLGVQWGNPSVAQYGLDFIAKQYGAPAQYLYGIAQAPYWTVDWSKNPQTPDDFNAALQTGNPCNPLALANWAQADKYVLKKLGYEIGNDDGQDPKNSTLRAQAQSLPSAGVAMSNGLASWAQGGGECVCIYQATYIDQQSGNWGLTPDPMNLTTPKYLAAVDAAKFMYFNDSPLPLPAPQPTPTPAPVQVPPVAQTSFKSGDGKTYTVTVNQA
jgi:hypothetical protein